jgi:hypothetical protein
MHVFPECLRASLQRLWAPFHAHAARPWQRGSSDSASEVWVSNTVWLHLKSCKAFSLLTMRRTNSLDGQRERDGYLGQHLHTLEI